MTLARFWNHYLNRALAARAYARNRFGEGADESSVVAELIAELPNYAQAGEGVDSAAEARTAVDAARADIEREPESPFAPKSDVAELAAEMRRIAERGGGEQHVDAPARRPVLVRLADVPPEPVHWLWYPYIPRRKLTLVVGDPGDGKTWMMLAIAAAQTRGWGFPDPAADGVPHLRCESGSALYLTAEDGLADTLRPRLDAMGADCSQFVALTGIRDGGTELPVTLRDLDVLGDALTATRAVLAVVDPLQAFMGDNLDMHRANEVRPVLAGLAQLAERHDCAVVCICHLSKATQSRALYRVLGSIDFAAAVRSVLLVGRDPEQVNRRAVVHIKSNLASEGPTLAYAIDNGQFSWCGLSTLTAASVLASDTDDGDRGALDQAKAFLTEILAAGPVSATEVHKQARAASVAERTLNRAKAKMRVRSDKLGATWAWVLPDVSRLPTLPDTELGNLGNVDMDEGVI